MKHKTSENGDVDVAVVDASWMSWLSPSPGKALMGLSKCMMFFMVRKMSTESDIYRVLSLADHVNEYYLAFPQLGR